MAGPTNPSDAGSFIQRAGKQGSWKQSNWTHVNVSCIECPNAKLPYRYEAAEDAVFQPYHVIAIGMPRPAADWVLFLQGDTRAQYSTDGHGSCDGHWMSPSPLWWDFERRWEGCGWCISSSQASFHLLTFRGKRKDSNSEPVGGI